MAAQGAPPKRDKENDDDNSGTIGEEFDAVSRRAPPLALPTEPKPAAPPVALGPISDFALIENATFTGVTRKEGKLFFTYDPARKHGKQSCPT